MEASNVFVSKVQEMFGWGLVEAVLGSDVGVLVLVGIALSVFFGVLRWFVLRPRDEDGGRV